VTVEKELPTGRLLCCGQLIVISSVDTSKRNEAERNEGENAGLHKERKGTEGRREMRLRVLPKI
jgi:hypothetical protein